ncbi:MAG: hypothetical protein LQ349_002993 [Xanthoria aureola]|nr:MAG: hypothetical protein LQ349_002993 [Xanthoria aureola]
MAAPRRYTDASTVHKSVDGMLNRPDLEDPNYIPLGWKESILDKKKFRSRYADFCEVFYRLLLMMGFCDYARLYPLHLNAASVLLSIYPNEKLYQGLASEGKLLFDFVAQFSMKRDPEAPIYATVEQLLSIERRRDVTALRQ